MRGDALSKDEKARIELVLGSADLMPARGGQVIINLDPQKRVSSVEIKSVIR